MKKILVLLTLAVAVVCSASAMSPRKAYEKLSKVGIPMETSQTDTLNLIDGKFILNCQSVKIQSLVDAPAVKKIGDKFENIIHKISEKDIVIGGQTYSAIGYIFADANAHGTYDVLIACASGGQGFFQAIIGECDQATLNLIRNSSIVAKRDHFQVILGTEGQSTANIIDV